MIELCGIKSITKVIVADIDMDAILGLDFLKANDCQIDITRDILTIKGQRCKLNLAGKLGCYRVTVSEQIEIPSRSEIIVEGLVHVPIMRKNDLGLIEPTEKSYQSGKGLVAKALVHTNEKIPLRIINLSNENEKIYPGTQVANLSFVSNVCEPQIKGPNKPKLKQVPDHLADLFQRSISGLAKKQCEEVAKLLTKHQPAFSRSDDDLGRTGIIRHKIPTGEAKPIKQSLRRLPIHMTDEADKQIDEML